MLASQGIHYPEAACSTQIALFIQRAYNRPIEEENVEL